ncbi:MAG: McrC family protein, partial [Eubacterium sp.]|nr:McrC family protein [Eubacterium sp.]
MKNSSKLIKITARDFTEYRQIYINREIPLADRESSFEDKSNTIHVEIQSVLKSEKTWGFYTDLLMAVNEKILSQNDLVYCTSPKYKEESLSELFTIMPHSIFVNGYVGRVYVSDIKIGDKVYDAEITIKSRLDYDDKNYFLITLLSRGRLNKAFGDSEIIGKNDKSFKFLIMFMYINALEKALRSGFYKEYVRYKRNDLNVRGRIDVSRHIKENSFSPDRIAYEYGEQTYDNPVNRLILAAADILKKYNLRDFLPVNLKNALSELSRQTFGYSFMSAAETGKAASKPITKSFYIKYEELRKVCLKVLKDEGVNIFETDQSKTKGLLMYVPELWENLVLYYFDKNLKGFKTESQLSYDIMLEEGKPWGLGPNSSRPDMIIKKDGKTAAVIDAKYKPGWMAGGEAAAEKRRPDINQVKAYMYDLNCRKGGIIYPTEKESRFHKYSSSEFNSEDFCVIAVSIPKIKKVNNKYIRFSEWKKELDNSFNILSELKSFI